MPSNHVQIGLDHRTLFRLESTNTIPHHRLDGHSSLSAKPLHHTAAMSTKQDAGKVEHKTKKFGKSERTVPHHTQKAKKFYPAEDESKPKKVCKAALRVPFPDHESTPNLNYLAMLPLCCSEIKACPRNEQHQPHTHSTSASKEHQLTLPPRSANPSTPPAPAPPSPPAASSSSSPAASAASESSSSSTSPKASS